MLVRKFLLEKDKPINPVGKWWIMRSSSKLWAFAFFWPRLCAVFLLKPLNSIKKIMFTNNIRLCSGLIGSDG